MTQRLHCFPFDIVCALMLTWCVMSVVRLGSCQERQAGGGRLGATGGAREGETALPCAHPPLHAGAHHAALLWRRPHPRDRFETKTHLMSSISLHIDS
jgi:hypothetical protein